MNIRPDSGERLAEDISLQRGSNAASDDQESAGNLLHEQIEFLRAQTNLHDLQAQKLKAELHHLHAEDKNIAVTNIRERLKLVFDVGLAVFGLAIVALIALLVYSAARSQSVVVDAFSVPPDFTAQGNTGVVVAGSFLDRLQTLQSMTHSAAQRHHVEDAWSREIKVDIPETGVSLGELLNYLRGWLGNDIHIGGSVVRAGDDIVLSVRGSGFPATSFAGKPGDLPKLVTQAAEYVYGRSEPYLYSAYLENTRRDKDAIAFITGIYSSVGLEQRANLLNVWGTGLAELGDLHDALEKYREQIRLNPEAWIAYANLIEEQIVGGDEEGGMQTAAQMERAAGIGSWFPKAVNPLYFQNQHLLRRNLVAVHRELTADVDRTGGVGTGNLQDQALDAEMLARLHETRAAELELETSPGAGADPYVITESALVRGLMGMEARQFAAAYRYVDAADRLVARSSAVAANLYTPPACLAGWLAEMTGHRGAADADIRRGGHFVDCYRFRADIADHRGKWAEAQKEYAAAVALVPSVPLAWFSWGDALMRHKDYRGAIAKFRLANAQGPHWADPLKRWGDALVALNRSDEALGEYEEAAKQAPRWGALQIAWGRALDYLGRHSEAVEKYRAALTMDLTGDEHWSLRDCCS